MRFPNVDPIPVPAPVWLMKALSLLTLALHFFAVQVLIGTLLAVCYLSYRGRSLKSSAFLSAASVVAKRLPVVMTYVINLGVPPLLFAQVLYGRALYTSSVLIAVMWISVIFLLVLVYALLYHIANHAAKGKSVAGFGLLALLIAAGIGDVYATNMTLMLRPSVWPDMYAKTAMGLQAPPHDPTTVPRWLFVVLGGFLVGGIWTALYGNVSTVDDAAKTALRKTGAGMAALGGLLQLGTGYWVYSTQPESVQEGLHTAWYTIGAGLWGVGVLAAFLVALALLAAKKANPFVPIVGCVCGFLGIAGAVIYRDGIRDVTLKAAGYNVWDRVENSNWFVIGLFLLLFVLGLAAIAWLTSVMKNANSISEQVNA
jgi:uncharacterized membrane protein